MIEMIWETQYNDKKITNEMIYNSFRYSDISDFLNHSEDHLFSSWSRMKEEKLLIENNLEKDYQFNDNIDDSKDILDED